MKSVTLNPIIFLALVVCFIATTIFSYNKSEYIEDQKKQLKQEKENLKIVRDSVQAVIKRKDGELLKAIRESAEADLIAEESQKQAEKYRKKYESVLFVRHDSDSARSAAIRATIKKANLQH